MTDELKAEKIKYKVVDLLKERDILYNKLSNERRKNRKLKKENADLKELLSLVYKDLISYKTNPNNLAVEGTFEMEKSVFMDWLHRVKPFVTEGEVKKMTKEEQLKEEAENKLDEWSDPDMGCEEGYCYSEVADFMFRFAEPREKKISELEERCNTLDESLVTSTKNNIERQKIIDERNNQFINAKEIISQLLLLPYANNEEVNADIVSILDKAERFIKE